MNDSYVYPIGYVARHAGLSGNLIRAWEVGCGHSISQVANLSLEEPLRLFGSDSSELTGCADEAKADSHSTGKYCINLLHLPANDIAAAVKSSRARAVALSINQFKDEKNVVKEIEDLKTFLNTGTNILICTIYDQA